MSTVAASVLDELPSGRIRAAWPDSAAPDGWRVDHAAKTAILGCFADRATRVWEVGPLTFRDRVGVPPKSILGAADAVAAETAGRPWRIVPGGTSIREGAHLEPGVVVMPLSFINTGAWIGAEAMVDSHVPGTRPIGSGFGALHGLAQTVPLIVKYRDTGTDRRVALEEALR